MPNPQIDHRTFAQFGKLAEYEIMKVLNDYSTPA